MGHLPTGLSSGWPHAAQGPNFKIPLPRSFVPRRIEYTCQVSSTSAQRSWGLRVLNMLTQSHRTDALTDRWTQGRTFDWFYKGPFIATQLNSTQLNSTRQREQQLTQFVGRDVINENTIDLAVRCSIGSVECS